MEKHCGNVIVQSVDIMRSQLSPIRILLGVTITILVFRYFYSSTAYGFIQDRRNGRTIKTDAVGVESFEKQSWWRGKSVLENVDEVGSDSDMVQGNGILRTKSDADHIMRTWSSSNDEIKHFVIERKTLVTETDTSVLYLTITRNAESWGRNPTESRRTIHSHLKMITNTTLPAERCSIGLLTASEDEFQRYIEALSPSSDDSAHSKIAFPFRRVTVILHQAPTRQAIPGGDFKVEDTSREARHQIPQHERRSRLAKLRNYLQLVALDNETHILWLDSDVYKFSDDRMVETMLKTTMTTDEVEVGVLTARCTKGEPEKADAWLADHPNFQIPDSPKDSDSPEKKIEIEILRGKEGGDHEIIAHKTNQENHFDLNAWAGRRTHPDETEQEHLWEDITSWTPSPAGVGQTQILDAVIQDTKDSDIRRLDSVGGTVLMIQADLVRMGLMFPVGYFVGMTYEHGEGYDGIESEGICLLTRSMSRDGNSTCYTMGGSWAVWHTVF